jgi:hypothetical protein
VITPARRRAGLTLLGVGAASAVVWFAWWLLHLEPHPITLLLFTVELAGFVLGAVVAIGLAGAPAPRRVLLPDPSTGAGADEAPDRPPIDRDREPCRYAWAVADVVGRTRTGDLQHDVRAVVRAARRSVRRGRADYAVASVVADGARRLVTVVVVAAALLLGVSPIPIPSPIALVSVAIAAAAMSGAHVLLSGGRIRIGDRTRWTYSSLGDLLGREDIAGVAPRRWVGTVGVIVGLNVAIALRGMSDRWTHGLRAMEGDDRVVAMLLGLVLVVGALYTLATTEAPRVDGAHLVSRRLEETTARQSVLGAAVCVGLVGLVAGVFPGSVDAADHDPGRIEQIEHDSGRDIDRRDIDSRGSGG